MSASSSCLQCCRIVFFTENNFYIIILEKCTEHYNFSSFFLSCPISRSVQTIRTRATPHPQPQVMLIATSPPATSHTHQMRPPRNHRGRNAATLRLPLRLGTPRRGGHHETPTGVTETRNRENRPFSLLTLLSSTPHSMPCLLRPFWAGPRRTRGQ